MRGEIKKIFEFVCLIVILLNLVFIISYIWATLIQHKSNYILLNILADIIISKGIFTTNFLITITTLCLVIMCFDFIFKRIADSPYNYQKNDL
jgi:uncharacterized protein HemY